MMGFKSAYVRGCGDAWYSASVSRVIPYRGHPDSGLGAPADASSDNVVSLGQGLRAVSDNRGAPRVFRSIMTTGSIAAGNHS